MTVVNEASYADLGWTGVETSFNPNFRARAPEHVKVRAIDAFAIETELTYGVHYTAELDTSGNVTVVPVALPPAPLTLRIYRVTPKTQPTDFRNLIGFDAATHTARHDEAALRDAELARDAVWGDSDVVAGFDGWSPILAVVNDGARRVHQVIDWTGGDGAKPPVGQYLGPAGWVIPIASAVDIRGAAGTPGAGTGDVIGDDTAVGAMQWAFYSNAGGKNVRGGKAIAPPQITAQTDNYNPANLATAIHLRMSSDAARDLTGITAPVVDVRPLVVGNIGAQQITLKEESASSTAANRFNLGGGDVTLFPGDHISLLYDLVLARWIGMSPRRMQQLMAPQGRLTLTTGTPVLAADVLAAVGIYYTPFVADQVPLWNGTVWTMATVPELLLLLDNTAAHAGYHQAAKNFNLFVFDDAGVKRLGSSPAWASDTSMGTGAGTAEVERKNGIWTNKNQMTLRWGNASGNTTVKNANQATWVGCFRASADGQVEWSANPAPAAGGGNCKLFLWNTYNRVPVGAASKDSTDIWPYASATWRPANNSGSNRITAIFGLNEESATVAYHALVEANNGEPGLVGVGLDSTTAWTGVPGAIQRANSTATQASSIESYFYGLPGIGTHFFQALEYGGPGIGSWVGDLGAPLNYQMALIFQGRM